MVHTHRFTLTGLMLDFWRESDRLKAIRDNNPELSLDDYRYRHLAVVRAAKHANHEALTRLLRKDHPIPYPWEGDGGIEQ